jgi:hypothetical protein
MLDFNHKTRSVHKNALSKYVDLHGLGDHETSSRGWKHSKQIAQLSLELLSMQLFPFARSLSEGGPVVVGLTMQLNK